MTYPWEVYEEDVPPSPDGRYPWLAEEETTSTPELSDVLALIPLHQRIAEGPEGVTSALAGQRSPWAGRDAPGVAGWMENVVESAFDKINPRNWFLGIMAMIEASLPPSGDPMWTLGEEKGLHTLTPIWEREGREQATWRPMLSSFIDPYTSWEKFGHYAYEDPAGLALDATIAFSGVRALARAGSGAYVRGLYRPQAERFSAAYRGMVEGEAATVGDAFEVLWRNQEYQEALARAQEAATGLTARTRGFLRVEPPQTIREYGAAPPVGEQYPGQTAAGRTPMQTWVTGRMDYWLGQAREYTAVERADLTRVFEKVGPAQSPRFNRQVVALSQFEHNPAVYERLLSEGVILPEVNEALAVWRRILQRESGRLQANGLLTPERAAQRARVAMRVHSENVAEFRKAMTEWERTTTDWRVSGAPVSESPPRPPNPFSLREDTRFIQEFPELFQTSHEGRILTNPIYYPHVPAEHLVRATVRDTINSLDRRLIGEFRHNWGELFKTETYSQNVMDVLRRNVARVNQSEAHWNFLNDVVDNYALRNWKPGQRVPEGYTIARLEGLNAFMGTEFEKMVVELAEALKETRGMAAIEADLLTDRLINQFSARTTEIVGAGKPYAIPVEVANHMRYHLAPANPWFVAVTDLAGVKDVWRSFVLSFRPAWQAINESTNLGLTSIMGGLPAWPATQELARRGARWPGMIARDSVMAEVGSEFGWAPKVQQALQNARLGWLVDWNRRLHGSRLMRAGRMSAEFNQLRDGFHKRLNTIGAMQREFRSAAAADVGMDIGARRLTPEQVRQVARSGDLMIDTMEEVLRGAGNRKQNAFLGEMVGRASEMTYSYNRMTPWQRKYLARAIPFVGWQLFTTGFLFRLPTRYPGRAWVLKSLASMGSDYLDNTLENYGVEPETIAEWDRTLVPLGPPGEDGQVPVIRVSPFRLYDMLETTDVVRTLFSHPAVQSILEIGGIRDFPRLEPPTTPPDWPEGKVPRRAMADILLELGFGSAYNLATKLVHPEQQYGVGGLVFPSPREYIEEPAERYDWRAEIVRYTAGVSFDTLESFEMMDQSHGRSRRDLEGIFRVIATDLRVVDEAGLRDVPEQILRQGRIRANVERYLGFAHSYLQQIDAMIERATTSEQIKDLTSDRKTYMDKVFRMERLLNTLILGGDAPSYIPPDIIYAGDLD